MQSPLHQAGAQHSLSPIDAVMGGDGATLEPTAISALFNFAQFQFTKINELGRSDLGG